MRMLDPLGLIHTALGVAALLLGALVLLSRKGTRRHRRIGMAYVVAMVLLNVTALMIYDLFGRFGPFHVAALVSLATVGAGFLTVSFKWPRRTWMGQHAVLMSWSYVGLLAALVSEIATHGPGVPFGIGVTAATIAVVVIGGTVIHLRVPALVRQQVPADRGLPLR